MNEGRCAICATSYSAACNYCTDSGFYLIPFNFEAVSVVSKDAVGSVPVRQSTRAHRPAPYGVAFF